MNRLEKPAVGSIAGAGKQTGINTMLAFFKRNSRTKADANVLF